LWLGKSKDNTNKLDLLDSLVKVYVQLFDELAKLEIEWIQLDEPVLVTELEPDWQTAFKKAYDALANSPIKLLLASYYK
jgi:5-methyltetrahydropteroyltriglutamate--homocysteine methyltransferase